MRNTRLALTGLSLAVWSCCACAGVNEWVHSAAAGASSVHGKVERAVKKGVEAGISGVERGTKAAGRGVETGAKKVGIPGGTPPGERTSPRGELPPAR